MVTGGVDAIVYERVRCWWSCRGTAEGGRRRVNWESTLQGRPRYTLPQGGRSRVQFCENLETRHTIDISSFRNYANGFESKGHAISQVPLYMPDFYSLLANLLSTLKRGASTLVGRLAVDTARGNLIPHVLKVQVREDIVGKLLSVVHMGPRAACILSAACSVAIADICPPGYLGSVGAACDGHFSRPAWVTHSLLVMAYITGKVFNYQSLQPTHMGLSLEIDMSAGAFYEPDLVSKFVEGYCNIRDFERPLSDQDQISVKNSIRLELVYRVYQAAQRLNQLIGYTGCGFPEGSSDNPGNGGNGRHGKESDVVSTAHGDGGSLWVWRKSKRELLALGLASLVHLTFQISLCWNMGDTAGMFY
ncbi:hypothetical protein Vadar_002199 [Vaccinium darrowii]|uniref:Uncharacterized protein n=1 Tax=Vaccinium darrowii TaxID=229202 RepID=A0ACB7YIL2_9ERIC|nr:hypothetical protein Vadar_002199 [Vaccinium darrowii]